MQAGQTRKEKDKIKASTLTSQSAWFAEFIDIPTRFCQVTADHHNEMLTFVEFMKILMINHLEELRHTPHYP